MEQTTELRRLLDELEQRLRAFGAPIVQGFSYGRSCRQCSDLLPRGWFPILVTGAKPAMWVDCGVPDHTPAPLYVDEHLPEPTGPLFRSLNDFVGTIIQAFDEGLTRPHPEDDRVPTFDARASCGAFPTGSETTVSFG